MRIEITDVQNSIVLHKNAKLKFLPDIGHRITVEEELYRVVAVNHDIVDITSDDYADIYIGVVPVNDILDCGGELSIK